jgi:glycosyltransferase involved in cell wall biosynthesis
MRIVIDMQGAQTESRFRGIGRYSLAFAQSIVRNRGEHEVILALNGMFPDSVEPIRAAFDGMLPQANIHVWHAPGPVRDVMPANAERREMAELIREAYLESLGPDVIHMTSVFEGYIDDAVTSIGRFDRSTPVSVSLYDLIPLLNAERYLTPSESYKGNYFRKIEFVRRAACLLTISESSRQEAIAHLGADAASVVNVSAASDQIFHPVAVASVEAEQICATYAIHRPFLLYSGGGDERKNLLNLVKAFAALPRVLRCKHQLVLAGKILADEVAAIRTEQGRLRLESEDIVFTGYVPDEALASLYCLCTAFVFPSFHEGFGLPALEAMACGAAVIGASTSSIPEVIGRTDALFDPHDVEDMSRCIAQVLEDEDFRSSLTAHGRQQAMNFSWDLTAQRAIKAFERVARPSDAQGQAARPGDLVGELVRAISSSIASEVEDGALMAVASAIARIPVTGRPRHLFVDVSELAQRDARTGVQRVTRSILNELMERPLDGYVVKPVLATIDRPGYFHANSFAERLTGRQDGASDELIDYQAGDIFLGLDLQHHTTRVQARYLDGMRANGVKVFFVVYDLLPVLFPDFWPAEHSVEQVHHEWLSVLSRFDGAICISRSVAEELSQWLTRHAPERCRPFQIGWFHLGADVQNSLPTTGMAEDAPAIIEQLAARPTFLTVGTIEPRKAHRQILDAFENLWAQGVDANVVFVGKKGWMVESLVAGIRSHEEFGKRLFWLEGISDQYLEKIYGSSDCLIAASYGEGFGLPLIEAAQHRLPLLVRDIPVFREVAGDHAYYFDGNSGAALAAAIHEWLELFRSEGHPTSDHLPCLTWNDSAEQLKSALMTLAAA